MQAVPVCRAACVWVACCFGSVACCVLHWWALHVASARVACCIGSRCMLHRSALHRSALHRSALHRSALHRCALHRRIGTRRTLHRRVASLHWRGLHRCIRARCIERRCDPPGAQTNGGGGGVLSMAKGTALFDAVAIAGTMAQVRTVGGGDASRADKRSGGCGRTGCDGRLWGTWLRRLCTGWRRGAHGRRGRHVQGRNDLEHRGGAPARRSRSHMPCRVLQILALCAALLLCTIQRMTRRCVREGYPSQAQHTTRADATCTSHTTRRNGAACTLAAPGRYTASL